jgi:hypothetical protein
MRKMLSFIFVFFLLAPTLAWMAGLEFGINVDRLGLKPPRLYPQVLLDNEYYLSFDQYFNDSFSIRGPLIYAKNWLDYHIFHTSDSREVHVGSNKWLYGRKSIKDFRKEACNDNAYVEQLTLELHALEKIIEASGRRFLFTIAPNKSTIYPEFVGFVPKGKQCNSSLYDLFLDKITAHPLNSFIMLDGTLREGKKNQALLYDKDDTRWNSLGAMIAAKPILKKMFDGQGEELVPDYKPIDIITTGDLTGKLMGLSVDSEEISIKHFRSFERPGLPSAVVYGDAFMSNLIPYMVGMFSTLDIVWTDRIPSRQHQENLKLYDVILIERAESEIKTIHLELDKIFSELETEDLALDRQWIDLMEVEPVSHISLEARKNGLKIKSVGAESLFEFISVSGSNDRIFRVLKLSIESPRPDVMKIEVMTDQPYVVYKPLKTGLTYVYLPLPFQKSISLRINPGKNVGLFGLLSGEIISFSRIPDIEPPVRGAPAVDVKNQEEDTLPRGGESADTVIPDTVAALPVNVKDNAAEKNTGNEMMLIEAEKTVPKAPSIVVTDFEEGQIFQRRGTSGDIIVSGTYTGQPVAVEARVVRDGTFEEVVPWTAIDPCPKNGIFLGVLHGVPQGGWYNIQVHYSENYAVSSKGSNKWAVGMLVACIGQSNMNEWFHTGKDFKEHSLLRKYTEKGWSELDMKGNAAIVFGNSLIERLDVPVGLLDYSENGSGLRKEADWGRGYWEDTKAGSIYSRFLSGVSAVGGSVEFIVWMQGEADAARGTVTEDEYRNSLENFITHQVRGDIGNGSSQKNLPFLIIMMSKRPGGKNGPHQAIRNAQKSVAATIADCYLAATTLDLKNQGRQHLAPIAYTTLGRRVAQTVLFILDKETYYRGPSVKAVTLVDSQTIDVTIQHRGGTDFTPDSGITGWEVLNDKTPLPLLKIYRHDSETIRIILKNTFAGPVKVRYLYGAMPDTTNPVLDNSAMALPLEEYQQGKSLDLKSTHSTGGL